MMRKVYTLLMESMEPKDPLNELPLGARVRLFLNQWVVWTTMFVLPLSLIMFFGIYIILRNIGGNL